MCTLRIKFQIQYVPGIWMCTDFLILMKGAGSRMPIIGPVDCQKTSTLITPAV